jgi:hypothetical protein
MLATLCVTSSLALVALGGPDPTGGFHLGTLSVACPSAIVEPILNTVVISHDVEGVSCEDVGWCINSCLLRLFTVPAGAHRFASLIVTPWGYKAGDRSCAQPTSPRTISHRLPTSFPTVGVVSPSLPSHGGVRLICVRGYARASAKPHESGVYNGIRARDLPHARGSLIPCCDGGIHRGMCGILRAGIWCVVTPMSPLFVAVLRLGTSSLDPLGDLTYGGLL